MFHNWSKYKEKTHTQKSWPHWFLNSGSCWGSCGWYLEWKSTPSRLPTSLFNGLNKQMQILQCIQKCVSVKSWALGCEKYWWCSKHILVILTLKLTQRSTNSSSAFGSCPLASTQECRAVVFQMPVTALYSAQSIALSQSLVFNKTNTASPEAKHFLL